MSEGTENFGRTGMEIAVIGMAGRFPGAESIDELWENLKKGEESITFFSEQELEEADIDPGMIKNPGYVGAKGILKDADSFDAHFFGYTPDEAELMDPQIRIFHECVWAALENAGYDPGAYDERIGLYSGASSNFYWEGLVQMTGGGRSVDQFTASQLCNKDFLSTYIAYKLNLKGPAFTIHTACSTSLVAVHVAVQGLLNGECEIALAGGVTLLLPQNRGYLFKEGMVMSPDGHCRAFDANSGGIVTGEGAAVVVLKLLETAEADGDYIHAVIKGSAINNDGTRKVGFAAPGVDGQVEVISAALYTAEVEAESIGYIEAHGTGTALGDPVEIEALKLAFETDKKQFCALGSIKTNIGHLDTAAGAAGLIKAVLVLKHRLIPPSLHFERPNPKIDFENSPFYVNTKLAGWENHHYPFRAGVSSFGIGGTNAHVILEEWPDRLPYIGRSVEQGGERKVEREYKLIVLSARTGASLDRATKNLVNHFRKNPGLNLADVVYTLQMGRKTFNHRRMLVCKDDKEAIDTLTSPGYGKSHQFSAANDHRPVVFMFSGQGSQYVNMGLGLYRTEPVFREEMDRCFDILKSVMGHDVKHVLYPGEEPTEEDREKINQFIYTSPIKFSFEYALARLLMKWGIQPRAMIGHSFGEYAAACLAGVFSLEDGLKLAALRGKLMHQMPVGAMLSVPLPEEQLKSLVNEEISIAAVNGVSLCIVSGPVTAIAAFEKQLTQQGHECVRLRVPRAGHSKMMTPILKEFEEGVAGIQLNKPQMPYISGMTGKWITAPDAVDPAYWARHLIETVRFADGLTELLKYENAIFVQVGADRSLTSFVEHHPDKRRENPVVNLLRHPRDEVPDFRFLLDKLGLLWLYGVAVDWAAYYSSEKRLRVPLPSYPFERRRYWLEGTLAAVETQALPTWASRLFPAGKPTTVPGRAVEREKEEPGAHPETELLERPGLSSDYAAPGTPLELSIAEIWQTLFGFKIGIHDDFFELGGDSLKAMTIGARLHKELSVEVPVVEFFNRPTISELAGYIKNAAESKFESIGTAGKKEYYPLSSAQKRLFILQRNEPENMTYNIPNILVLEGPLHRNRMETCFRQLIKRHESLRTSFDLVANESVQKIHDQVEFKIDCLEAEEDPGGASPGTLHASTIKHFVRPFDLSQAPLLRVGLMKLEEEKHYLMVDMHHIISDGLSFRILANEFTVLYEGGSLPSLKLQYKDFAEWQNRQVDSGEIKKQETYWLKEFKGEIPILNIPIDYPRPAIQSFEGNYVAYTLSAEQSDQLRELAGAEKVTMFTLLFAIYYIFLSKLSGQEDIVVGTVIAGRGHVDLEPLIGMFVNTLALRNYPSGEITFGEFLKVVNQRTLEAFDNQDYQFEDLVEKVLITRDTSRNPLFDVLFTYIPKELRAPLKGDTGERELKVRPYGYEDTTIKFDMALGVFDTGGPITFNISFNTKIFRKETLQRFINYFKEIVFAVKENRNTRLKDIEVSHDLQVTDSEVYKNLEKDLEF